MTREFLDAGLRLLAKRVDAIQMGPGNAESREPHSLLPWLSQRAVVAEMKTGKRPRSGMGALRERWPAHDHFVEDLLSYALWKGNWHANIVQQESMLQQVSGYPDLPALMHDIALKDLRAARNNLYFRVQIIAAVLAQQEPALHEAIQELYDVIGSSWTDVYQHLLDLHNCHLRSDVPMERFADMLTAAAEGVALRQLVDRRPRVIDEVEERSLLGYLIMAIVAGCVRKQGDDRTVDEIVRSLERA
ncbi:hypothetical protein [Cryptosporangium phraense]|uniref:Uncharacterized protein n=1 Tax=Cryptosporangium phraense TaxID=2593070 RepID=A0A545AMR5_9ACTN|nr:hypothetical protein [Cryptosporangium phraense]TQS42560.1 hypothetical protein FL583_22975 [Cryptosporangium phraense]